jgi:hypothetical protein
MDHEDAKLMQHLVDVANQRFDGHVTIMKFTKNWRVGFGTPYHDYDTTGTEAQMAVGKTFAEAATKALKNPQQVSCITVVDRDVLLGDGEGI